MQDTAPTTSTYEDEEVEGLDNSSEAGWSGYAIDTVLIRTESRTVFDVVRRIDKGSFVMDPDFQRAFLWSEDKQSKLIESVIMRLPLPVFYLAEDDQGRMIVVDGLQRLTTFHRFLNDKLKLKLNNQDELNGKRFSDLSSKLQNRIEDCNLVLYIVDPKVPEQARLDIFERVNGGVPLTRQQMRNCLYMGSATRFLCQEAETPLFLQATGKSLRTDKMRDREMVNRFCAFHLLGIDEYKNDMDDFLARCLRKMNTISVPELQKLSGRFRQGLQNNWTIFGSHAFRKHTPNVTRRSIFNAALWDVQTTGLSDIPEALAKDRAVHFKDQFFQLLKDPEFEKSISLFTNNTNQVRIRFKAMRQLIGEVFGA